MVLERCTNAVASLFGVTGALGNSVANVFRMLLLVHFTVAPVDENA